MISPSRSSLVCRYFYPAARSVPGFTLIELLAIIAILAVLFAILIPVVGKISESSKSTKCLSNLRQIGIGHISYRADHNGAFAPLRNPTAPQTFWPYVLMGQADYHPWFNSPMHPQQVRLRAICACPSTDRRQVSGARTYDYLSNVEAWSGVTSVSFPGSSTFQKKPSAAAEDLSKLIVAADASLELWPTNSGATGPWMLVGDRTWESREDQIRESFGTYHGGRFNAVFASGHAASMRPEDLTKENVIFRATNP